MLVFENSPGVANFEMGVPSRGSLKFLTPISLLVSPSITGVIDARSAVLAFSERNFWSYPLALLVTVPWTRTLLRLSYSVTSQYSTSRYASDLIWVSQYWHYQHHEDVVLVTASIHMWRMWWLPSTLTRTSWYDYHHWGFHDVCKSS